MTEEEMLKKIEQLTASSDALKAANDKLLAEKSEADKARMKADGQFKELLEKETAEKNSILAEKEKLIAEKTALEKTIAEKDNQILTARKASAFKSKLGGKLKKSIYIQNANLDDIKFGDDGSIDLNSVDTVVKKFRDEFPELIETDKKTNFNPPSAGTADKSSAGLTFAEWKRLSVKDRKERIGEVVDFKND